MATKETTASVLKLQGTGASGGRLCQVLPSSILDALATYEIQLSVWCETTNVAVVEIFDGDSCTADPASKRVLQLKTTQAGAWSTVSHRFQASAEAVISVALVAGTGTSLWMSGVDVYRVLCTPLPHFTQSLPRLKFGAQGYATVVSPTEVYIKANVEQAFGETPYTGTDDDIIPFDVYASSDVTNKCSSALANRDTCWSRRHNKNIRKFDMKNNVWSDAPLPELPEGKMGAELVSCAGRLWILGGYTDYQSPAIGNQMWVYTPGDSSWDATSHKVPDSADGVMNVRCWKDEILVGTTSTAPASIFKYVIAEKKFEKVSTADGSFVPKHPYGFSVAIWQNKLIVTSGRTTIGVGTDNALDQKSTRVFDLITDQWETAMPLFPLMIAHYPPFGIIENFAFVQVQTSTPGSHAQELWMLDLMQRSGGRWLKTTSAFSPKRLTSCVNSGFSLICFGGYDELGYIPGKIAHTFAYSSEATRLGACPAGCFMERASPEDICNACPPGSYNSFDDQAGKGSCIPCSDGAVASIHGATSCKSCSAGWSSPPGGTCCSPAVTVLPRTVSFPSVQLGSKSTVDLFVIHSGPHSVSWHIDPTTLPPWLNVSQITGTLTGGHTLTLQLTTSHTNTSAALGTEDFSLAIVVGKKEQATTTFIDASSRKQLFACDEKDVMHGILQTQVVQTTFERITGDVHASSSTIAFATGELVKSIFEWTLLTNDQGGRRIFTGGADVTAKVGSLTVDVDNIFDNRDGTYTIRYVPQAEGNSFTLSVFVNGLSATTTSFEVKRATCSESSGARTVADGSSCECGPGSSRQNVDDTGACAKCSAGFYQSSSGEFTCTPCPAGLYGPTVGAVGLDKCVTCTLGRTGITVGLASADSCSECSKGTFGSAPGVCSPCESTNYTTSTGALFCIASKIGEKFVSFSFAPLLCDAGTFGSAPGNCTACGDMEYSISKGSTSCVQAEIGEQFMSSSSAPQACDAGTFGSAPGNCTACGDMEYSISKGSTSCVKAEIGEQFMSSSSAPQACDAGTFGSVAGVCTACGDMEYSISKRSTSCVKVKIGEEFVSSSSVPQDCNTGFFGSTPGVCSKCTVGQYQDRKGESECQECPVDTYLSEAGKSSEADCKACPDMRGTRGVKAVNIKAACLCKRSTMYKEDGTSDGYYGGYDGEDCQPCAKGATCGFDGARLQNLTAQVGYWRTSLNSDSFSDCSKGYQGLNAVELSKQRCCPLDLATNISVCQRQNNSNQNDSESAWSSDSQCLENYRGVLCLECVKGYVRVGDECKKCEGGANLGMAFLAGAAMIVPVFVFVLIYLTCEGKTNKAAQAGNKVFGQIKIMIAFVQILSSMKTTYNGIPWPLAFTLFLIPLGAINLDVVGLFGTSVCSMAVPFASKFLVHMSMPPMLAVGIIAAYFVSKYLKPPKTEHFKAHRRAQTIKLLLGLILFMYPGLATRCFQMFKCLKFEGVEGSVLEADPSMICYQSEHATYITLALIFIGVYVVGIPLGMLMTLWRNKKYLYVEEGEEMTEKHMDIGFELGGMYHQCKC
mgnify:CR=1 FL=1